MQKEKLSSAKQKFYPAERETIHLTKRSILLQRAEIFFAKKLTIAKRHIFFAKGSFLAGRVTFYDKEEEALSCKKKLFIAAKGVLLQIDRLSTASRASLYGRKMLSAAGIETL